MDRGWTTGSKTAETRATATIAGTRTWPVACVALLLSGGCGEGPGRGKNPGKLTVVLDAEATIVDGLQSGTQSENIRDGFDVSYTRHLIAIGLVSMSKGDGRDLQTSDVVGIADYTRLPPSLHVLTVFERIPVGRYTRFGFATPAPNDNATNINSVPQSDVDAMVANGWSFVIEGRLTRVSDRATKDFLIEADVPAVYADCAVDGAEPGVGVGTNASASISMHGDHLFFNGFPADESGVMRLAQWMWDVEDVDADNVLTRTDFEAATDVGRLFPIPTYTLSGGPLPIANAWDFVRAQLGTTGHIFGEGGCEWGHL